MKLCNERQLFQVLHIMFANVIGVLPLLRVSTVIQLDRNALKHVPDGEVGDEMCQGNTSREPDGSIHRFDSYVLRLSLCFNDVGS